MANTSILNTVKKAIGISPDDDSFDDQLIMYINSSFAVIHQLGVGPKKNYVIEDANNKWDEYMESSYARNIVQNLLVKEVQKKFDPPTSSSVTTALNEEINELIYRLNMEAEVDSDTDID